MLKMLVIAVILHWIDSDLFGGATKLKTIWPFKIRFEAYRLKTTVCSYAVRMAHEWSRPLGFSLYATTLYATTLYALIMINFMGYDIVFVHEIML